MKNYQGCRDTQTQAQKARNYTFNEVCAGAAPVNWVEKLEDDWKHYPVRNQDGSATCVCMTYATEQGILFNQKYGKWMDFSSTYPYQQRKYPSNGGCTSEDIYSIFPKLGNVYDTYMPSQNMNDSQISLIPKETYYDDLAKTYKVARIALPLDFETIASTIQETGKGVMVWFGIGHGEWTDMPQYLGNPPASNHSVTAIDFTLKNGKKYLIIQDSYGLVTAAKGLRLISEEYFKARCFLASYLMTFQLNNDALTERPKFDGSIMSAQRCFKWEGLFPLNVADTENWGPITRNACIAFQKRYNIEPALGNLGPITIAKLSEVYK